MKQTRVKEEANLNCLGGEFANLVNRKHVCRIQSKPTIRKQEKEMLGKFHVSLDHWHYKEHQKDEKEKTRL